MAKITKQPSITCDICGKEVPPAECGIPVDYVWFEGTKICNECLASGRYNKVQKDGEPK